MRYNVRKALHDDGESLKAHGKVVKIDGEAFRARRGIRGRRKGLFLQRIGVKLKALQKCIFVSL